MKTQFGNGLWFGDGSEHSGLGDPADFQGFLSWGCGSDSGDGSWKTLGEWRPPRPGGTPTSLGLWEG